MSTLGAKKSGSSPPGVPVKYEIFKQKLAACFAKQAAAFKSTYNGGAVNVPLIITSIQINDQRDPEYLEWYKLGAILTRTERSNYTRLLIDHLAAECSNGDYNEDASLNLIVAFSLGRDFLYSSRWPGPLYHTLVLVLAASGKVYDNVKGRDFLIFFETVCFGYESAMSSPLTRTEFASATLNFWRVLPVLLPHFDKDGIKPTLGRINLKFNLTSTSSFTERIIRRLVPKDANLGPLNPTRQVVWKPELTEPLTEQQVEQFLNLTLTVFNTPSLSL